MLSNDCLKSARELFAYGSLFSVIVSCDFYDFTATMLPIILFFKYVDAVLIPLSISSSYVVVTDSREISLCFPPATTDELLFSLEVCPPPT